jgi:Tfp pilus assembly protein PilF
LQELAHACGRQQTFVVLKGGLGHLRGGRIKPQAAYTMGAARTVRQAASQDISGHFVTATQNTAPRETRLDSWKAIAAFFGRDERTVKRWEKERGLPVHRLPGAAKGSVFAYIGELERWLAGPENDSGLRIEESPARVEPAIASESAATTFAAVKVEEQVPAPRELGGVGGSSFWRRSLQWAVPIVLVGGFLIYSSSGRSPIRFGKALAAHHPPDATAQDLYLKGRFYFEKRTPNDLNAAVDAFTQAIVHDPGYAQAYVGLADSYSLLREFSTMPLVEAEGRARAAAQKAVELDPNLAEAHTSLAFAEFWGFLDAAGADREFRRAIELDPNLARAHHWYATFLIEILRPQEALEEIERARQLDPSSKAILADKGVLLMWAGHPEEALSLLKQMEVSDPNFRSSHEYLAQVYWEQGKYEDALEEYRQEALLRGGDEAVKDVAAWQAAFRAGGVNGLFQYRLNAALKAYEHENGSPFDVASAYGYLRQREGAMKYLEVARQRRDLGLANVELAPEFRWLHSDPEFQRLVVDVGLPAVH